MYNATMYKMKCIMYPCTVCTLCSTTKGSCVKQNCKL